MSEYLHLYHICLLSIRSSLILSLSFSPLVSVFVFLSSFFSLLYHDYQSVFSPICVQLIRHLIFAILLYISFISCLTFHSPPSPVLPVPFVLLFSFILFFSFSFLSFPHYDLVINTLFLPFQVSILYFMSQPFPFLTSSLGLSLILVSPCHPCIFPPHLRPLDEVLLAGLEDLAATFHPAEGRRWSGSHLTRQPPDAAYCRPRPLRVLPATRLFCWLCGEGKREEVLRREEAS